MTRRRSWSVADLLACDTSKFDSSTASLLMSKMDSQGVEGLSRRTTNTISTSSPLAQEGTAAEQPSACEEPSINNTAQAQEQEEENRLPRTDGQTNGTCLVDTTSSTINMSIDNAAADASSTGAAAGPAASDDAKEPYSQEAFSAVANAVDRILLIGPSQNTTEDPVEDAENTITHDSPRGEDNSKCEVVGDADNDIHADNSSAATGAAVDTIRTNEELGVGEAIAAMGTASAESGASILTNVRRNGLFHVQQVPPAAQGNAAAAESTHDDLTESYSDDASDDSFVDNAAPLGIDAANAADNASRNIDEAGPQEETIRAPQIVRVSSSGPSAIIAEASSALGPAARKKKRAPPPVRDGQSTGRWTHVEHESFLEGLKVYGREWKKVALRIPTRTSAQVRSHAQKYFAKLSRDESMVEQEQQSNSLDSSSGTAAATGDSYSATATAVAQSYPPSIQRNVERILANPEQAQRDVENTLLALRERYRQLQRRLQEYPPSPPGQRPVVENEPEEEKEEDEQEEESGDESEQLEEAHDEQQRSQAAAAAAAPHAQPEAQARDNKRKRGESEGSSSSTATSLSSLEREELIAVSVLGGALANGGSPSRLPPAEPSAIQPNSNPSNGEADAMDKSPPKESGADASPNAPKRQRQE